MKSMYGKILGTFCSLYAVSVFGLVISWTTTSVDMGRKAVTWLEALILILHGLFFALVFFV